MLLVGSLKLSDINFWGEFNYYGLLINMLFFYVFSHLIPLATKSLIISKEESKKVLNHQSMTLGKHYKLGCRQHMYKKLLY